MRLLAVLALLLLPAAALAQSLPALYDVTGVAIDDTLNIRARPTTSAPILSALAPKAAGVEVIRLSETGAWGLVNSNDTAGWVSMRYMVRRPGQDFGAVPAEIGCFGTEPFWAFNAGPGSQASFDSPLSNDAYLSVTRLSTQGRPDEFALVAEGPAGRVTAIVSPAACTDGMSDREYGLAIGLVQETSGAPAFFTGCCTLQH